VKADRVFLDAYEPARDPAAFEHARQSRAKGTIGEVHAFEPHCEGSPAVLQPADKATFATLWPRTASKASADHHLAAATLPSGRNGCETLGFGYTLLAFGVVRG
jgi:hypothetical protein